MTCKFNRYLRNHKRLLVYHAIATLFSHAIFMRINSLSAVHAAQGAAPLHFILNLESDNGDLQIKQIPWRKNSLVL